MRKIEIDEAVWEGVTHYLRSLHQQAAVDDIKMKFDNYKPLAELLNLWGIEPYSRHAPVTNGVLQMNKGTDHV